MARSELFTELLKMIGDDTPKSEILDWLIRQNKTDTASLAYHLGISRTHLYNTLKGAKFSLGEINSIKAEVWKERNGWYRDVHQLADGEELKMVVPTIYATSEGFIVKKKYAEVGGQTFHKYCRMSTTQYAGEHANYITYPRVRIHCPRTGDIGYKSIHRLIADAFVDGYQEGMVCRFKNGNRYDAHPSNLYWTYETSGSREPNTKRARGFWITQIESGKKEWCTNLKDWVEERNFPYNYIQSYVIRYNRVYKGYKIERVM